MGGAQSSILASEIHFFNTNRRLLVPDSTTKYWIPLVYEINPMRPDVVAALKELHLGEKSEVSATWVRNDVDRSFTRKVHGFTVEIALEDVETLTQYLTGDNRYEWSTPRPSVTQFIQVVNPMHEALYHSADGSVYGAPVPRDGNINTSVKSINASAFDAAWYSTLEPSGEKTFFVRPT